MKVTITQTVNMVKRLRVEVGSVQDAIAAVTSGKISVDDDFETISAVTCLECLSDCDGSNTE